MDDSQEARVRVEPGGLAFEARAGESIMAAAQRHGYRWPTVCNGAGECLVCRVTVTAGADQLSADEPLEVKRLQLLNEKRSHEDRYRLACQARVHGDVVVHKRGVR